MNMQVVTRIKGLLGRLDHRRGRRRQQYVIRSLATPHRPEAYTRSAASLLLAIVSSNTIFQLLSV
jgi:hypothetical protein